MRRSVANVVRSADDWFMLVFFVEKQWMPPSIMNYRSDTIVVVFTIIRVLFLSKFWFVMVLAWVNHPVLNAVL